MRKSMYLVLAIMAYSTSFANSGPLIKSDLILGKQLLSIGKPAKNPCTVTVENHQVSWAQGCNDRAVLLMVTGSCSKTADDCDLAYIKARDCAYADGAAKMEAAKKETQQKDCIDFNSY